MEQGNCQWFDEGADTTPQRNDMNISMQVFFASMPKRMLHGSEGLSILHLIEVVKLLHQALQLLLEILLELVGLLVAA
jgi:hypothetical protein